jgi:hypothetical protein
VLILSEGLDDQSEVEEGQKDDLSLSKREKMRRKPLSLWKSLSISLRLRYMALSYCQGCRRLLLGGTAKVQSQLEGRVVLLGVVHDET